MKIGFIGMGIMGRPMAMNLVKAGYELSVYNRHPERCAPVTALGAAEKSLREIAETCDLILTMLPNSPQVREVVLGDQVLPFLHPGQTLIDCSSIDPIASREIAEVLRGKGVSMLDAPVSGGEPKAIDGTLSFMVGGDRAVFDEYQPVLAAMGASVVYCGEIGAGNTTKLANQVIVAANIAAVAEGFMLAKRAGVDPNTVYAAIRGGLAGSTVMDAKGPMMLSNNTAPGFKIDLHIKDLGNALSAGEASGAPMPLTALTMEMLRSLSAEGYGACDHSALAKYYEKRTGTDLF